MRGIFGMISPEKYVDFSSLDILEKSAKRRGGAYETLIYDGDDSHQVVNGNCKAVKAANTHKPSVLIGITEAVNNLPDYQPAYNTDVCIVNSGLILNNTDREIDSSSNNNDILLTLAEGCANDEEAVAELPNKIMQVCSGCINVAIILPKLGKLLLFSNSGSLYLGRLRENVYFASEKAVLKNLKCTDIKQLLNSHTIFDIPYKSEGFTIPLKTTSAKKIFNFHYNKNEDNLLQYDKPALRRCSKCLLPETMPFIKFDEAGVCNYCHTYKLKNTVKPKDELTKVLEPYRKKDGVECIVPFSGGRDSCYGLHVIVNELKLKPITYTYDWGMATDLAMRNISLMCSKLGVENIVVSADIAKKRENIRMNLTAWLKHPQLGMLNLLTAGDKHFFKYIETIKKETGVALNLWSINPLEVTHFKTGFLGLAPEFTKQKVYNNGLFKQIHYHSLRIKEMLKSPGYFNSSIFDTLSGEYYRSFTKKTDYYHIYDYWQWNESIINTVLDSYGWEKAPDTHTTWRIGDGTAAFYNYVYYTVAGFTEHDTFRSNQIREGQLSREEALAMIEDENRPRYQNIKWYLDVLGFDFETVIKVINNIPKMYNC